MRSLGLVIGLLAACGGGASSAPPAAPPPEDARLPPGALAPGLTHERIAMQGRAVAGADDDRLDLVRVDVAAHPVRVLTAKVDGGARPLPRWADDFGLAAAINAGMFTDDQRPVALLAGPGHDDPREPKPQFGGFVFFDPIAAGDPALVYAGRDCPGVALSDLRTKYRGVVQGYRMLDCDGRAIAWKDAKAYSAAAIGVDRGGRLVLAHVRAAHPMRDLAATLATLDLAGAIFVEGGPEASLVARGPGGAVARVGSYETGFHEADDNTDFWKLPLVLGVAR